MADVVFTIEDGADGAKGDTGAKGDKGDTDAKGDKGDTGAAGANGENGQTPFIGENGNWWIGQTDTGVKAAGDDGKDGAIIVATVIGSAALVSNLALVAWVFIRRRFF